MVDEVKSILPGEDSKRLGQRKEVYAGYEGIKTVDWKALCMKKGGTASSMQTVGKLPGQILQANPTTVRIFSPDELMSNNLMRSSNIRTETSNGTSSQMPEAAD